jgi:hypothetical protein
MSQGDEIVKRLYANAQQLLAEPAVGEAYTLLTTGVVIVNEEFDYVRGVLRSEIQETDNRFIRLTYTLAHESIHISQWITTGHIAGAAATLTRLCAEVARNRKKQIPEAQWLGESLTTFKNTVRPFTAVQRGFSGLDVVELHAILEGFRGAFSRYSEAGLLTVVQLAHGLDTFYADIVGRVLAAFGFEFTFEVVPKLCWLSLQMEDPGDIFTEVLSSLAVAEYGSLMRMSATDVCKGFGLEPETCARSMRERYPSIRNLAMYPLMERYFDIVERETTVERRLQRAMHPGRIPENGQPGSDFLLMPTLTMFANGNCIMNGPYKDKDWDFIEPLIHAAAITADTLKWLSAQDLSHA